MFVPVIIIVSGIWLHLDGRTVIKLGTAWTRLLLPQKCSVVREEEARTMMHVLQRLRMKCSTVFTVCGRRKNRNRLIVLQYDM